ncbi:hypothetical protein OG21DRAFT_1520772 [Imleria badia]|nr:hypothetical protein OG21DRAFT_1520772 [Imleria badia]
MLVIPPYLPDRFRLYATTLYTFFAALHSVFGSTANANLCNLSLHGKIHPDSCVRPRTPLPIGSNIHSDVQGNGKNGGPDNDDNSASGDSVRVMLTSFAEETKKVRIEDDSESITYQFIQSNMTS